MFGMLSTTVSLIKGKAGRIIPAFLFSLPASIFSPVSQAYAVQTHGGAEGLVSHQLGHFLFTLAMVFLLLRMRKSRLIGPGWLEFRGFLWLIILWNVLTFAGHWMREGIPAEQFMVHSGRISAFHVNSVFDLIFYLTRLDHLLLVPAFFLLLLSIRNWERAG
jgi:hypothetical protein